jgi:hypothetical protein
MQKAQHKKLPDAEMIRHAELVIGVRVRWASSGSIRRAGRAGCLVTAISRGAQTAASRRNFVQCEPDHTCARFFRLL